MADETTYTTGNDLRYDAMIHGVVKKELRGANVTAKFCDEKSLVGLPSKAMDFPIWPTVSAAAVAEGADLANTAIATTKATVTAAEVGVMAEPTDVLTLSDILDGLDGYAGCLGRSLGTKLDSDICALFGSFDNSVGSTGTDMTEANFLSALYTLENANAPRPYVAVLHPVQCADFRVALSTATGVIHTSRGVSSGTAEVGEIDINGYWGTLYEVPIHSTTNVNTANTAADRAGAMYSSKYALGLCPKYISRTELERDASMRATEIVCTAFYGVGEIIGTAGVAIITDA